MTSSRDDLPGFADGRPFLRWAGSKRRLLKHLIPFIPATFGKYYEPFLGGGSLFFFMRPDRAEISDVSKTLIDIYRAVKRDAEGALTFLRPLRPSRTAFERMKKLQPRTDSQLVGTFIFLNRTCWNGLYRVNSDGVFNVPYGRPKTNHLIDEDVLLQCAKLLRRRSVSIRCQDFEAIEARVQKEDFVFFDPPYVTSHNMNGFVDWNENLFSWNDQVRLASLTKRLIHKGANVLVTNADHEDVRALYKGLRCKQIVRFSTLAGDKSRRIKTTEAIFAGGPAYDIRRTGRSRNGVSIHANDGDD